MIGGVVALFLAGCSHETPSEARAREVLEQIRISDVDVVIHCLPADAEVAVDDVPRGLCSDYAADGAGISLPKGMHRITVRKDGFFPYETWYAPSGARLSLDVTLRPRK